MLQTLVIQWAMKNPWKALLIAAAGIAPFIMIPLICLVLFLGVLDPSVTQQVNNMPLPGTFGSIAVKPGVIPAKILPALSAAAMKERVPLQLLAGEAETESAFHPNATNYTPSTHAMGIFQFEPQTWSGSGNPYASNTTYDTNPARIKQYGGMGVDADGNGSADPFDPADAAMSAAIYLRTLYDQYNHSWNLASFWYGSETQAYVTTVMGYEQSFIESAPPVPDGNGFWFLGGMDYKVVKKSSNSITLSSPQWTPIVAPVSGTTSIKYSNSGDTISIGGFKFTGSIVAWANDGSSTQAGTVVGFATGSIHVSGDVSSFSIPSFSSLYNKVMAIALKYEGYPYVYGGASPKTSFDCSGLTQYVFSKAGIKLPRTAQQQWDATQHIPQSQARPGDLVFFSGTYDDPGNTVTHVGIFVGGDMMYAADSSGIGYASLNSPFWEQHLWC